MRIPVCFANSLPAMFIDGLPLVHSICGEDVYRRRQIEAYAINLLNSNTNLTAQERSDMIFDSLYAPCIAGCNTWLGSYVSHRSRHAAALEELKVYRDIINDLHVLLSVRDGGTVRELQELVIFHENVIYAKSGVKVIRNWVTFQERHNLTEYYSSTDSRAPALSVAIEFDEAVWRASALNCPVFKK